MKRSVRKSKSDMFADEEEYYNNGESSLTNETEERETEENSLLSRPVRPVWGYPVTKPLFWAELLVIKGITGYIQIYSGAAGLLNFELHYRFRGGLFIIAAAALYVVWAFIGGKKAGSGKNHRENEGKSSVFDFNYPLTNMVFWICFSLSMAAAKLIRDRALSRFGWQGQYQLLVSLIPFMAGAGVYLIWAFAAAKLKSRRRREKKCMSVSDAWASTLTGKEFWISWAVTAAAFGICLDFGIVGELLWLIAVFMIFVDDKTGRNQR